MNVSIHPSIHLSTHHLSTHPSRDSIQWIPTSSGEPVVEILSSLENRQISPLTGSTNPISSLPPESQLIGWFFFGCPAQENRAGKQVSGAGREWGFCSILPLPHPLSHTTPTKPHHTHQELVNHLRRGRERGREREKREERGERKREKKREEREERERREKEREERERRERRRRGERGERDRKREKKREEREERERREKEREERETERERRERRERRRGEREERGERGEREGERERREREERGEREERERQKEREKERREKGRERRERGIDAFLCVLFFLNSQSSHHPGIPCINQSQGCLFPNLEKASQEPCWRLFSSSQLIVGGFFTTSSAEPGRIGSIPPLIQTSASYTMGEGRFHPPQTSAQSLHLPRIQNEPRGDSWEVWGRAGKASQSLQLPVC
ncbi:Histone-lysine N-methyltransferase, H3 lysine-79 specific, partial [Ophiophagus hannah]